MNSLVSGTLVEAVGWTLIHSLWQGAALALAAAAFRKSAAPQNARASYAIYSAALAGAVLWSAVTFTSVASRVSPVGTSREPVAWQVPATPSGEADPVIATEPVSSGIQLGGWMPLIVSLWGCGVLLMSIRLSAGALWVRRLRRTAARLPEPAWREKVERWCAGFGMRRVVQLCGTTLSDVPAVIGHFRPLILVPVSLLTQLTPQQLDSVILHELMHIRRNDYLVNLLQIWCETLFFFNPAVWWLSRVIRLEREQACDELVTAHTGDKLGYAKALVRLEELRDIRGGGLVLAVTGGPLKRRIARLLDTQSRTFNAHLWTAPVLAVIAVIATIAFTRSGAVAEEMRAAVFELRLVVEPGTPGAKKPAAVARPEFGSLFLSREVLMDNRHFASVQVRQGVQTKQPEIFVELAPEGATQFAEVTGAHINQKIAIVVEGKLLSAPVVREAITGGAFVISGNFSEEEANRLAEKLRPKNSAAPSKPQAGWTPPPNAVPSAILEETRGLIASGKFAEALERLDWYFVASRHEPGQAGVRLSFALSDWLALGRQYPPALARMKQIRDERAAALLTPSPEQSADELTLFQEFTALNRTLDDEPATVALFRRIRERNPERARQLARVAQPALLRTGEIDLAAEFANPEDFKVIRLSFEQPRERISAAGLDSDRIRLGEKRFLNQAATLIALLVRKGDTGAASEIATQAMSAWSDPAMRIAVENALRGKLPEELSSANRSSAVSSVPSDDTAEERHLLEKEIGLSRQELSAIERAYQAGRTGDTEVAERRRRVVRLEYELAYLARDNEAMIRSLEKEISLLGDGVKLQKKKIEVGAEAPESVLPIERDLIRAQRELAATRKGRPPVPSRAAR